MTNYLSKKVLERFMKPEEMEALVNSYNQNKQIRFSRFDTLKKPVTEEEANALREYLDESKSTKGNDYKMGTIAKRMLFQKMSL